MVIASIHILNWFSLQCYWYFHIFYLHLQSALLRSFVWILTCKYCFFARFPLKFNLIQETSLYTCNMQGSVSQAKVVHKLRFVFYLNFFFFETDTYTNKCNTLWYIQCRVQTQKMVWSILPGLVGEVFSEDMEEITLKMTLESWLSVWQASKN